MIKATKWIESVKWWGVGGREGIGCRRGVGANRKEAFPANCWAFLSLGQSGSLSDATPFLFFLIPLGKQIGWPLHHDRISHTARFSPDSMIVMRTINTSIQSLVVFITLNSLSRYASTGTFNSDPIPEMYF